ncbi:MAG: hypothetical protein IKO68_13090 [Oscillospiraceae bacterium]|nr:hypothetical protein [Oscillospiraceae bacterium]
MRYAKLQNEAIVYAPNPITINGVHIGNPPQELYLQQGYKPVRYAELPAQHENGYYEAVWEQTEAFILQNWVWHEATDEDELSDEETLHILLGGTC